MKLVKKCSYNLVYNVGATHKYLKGVPKGNAYTKNDDKTTQLIWFL